MATDIEPSGRHLAKTRSVGQTGSRMHDAKMSSTEAEKGVVMGGGWLADVQTGTVQGAGNGYGGHLAGVHNSKSGTNRESRKTDPGDEVQVGLGGNGMATKGEPSENGKGAAARRAKISLSTESGVRLTTEIETESTFDGYPALTRLAGSPRLDPSLCTPRSWCGMRRLHWTSPGFMDFRKLLSDFPLVLALLAAAFVAVGGEQDSHVEVQLSIGRLRGQQRRETYDIGRASITDTVDQYFGVPYAEPPLGKLRFQAPRPPSSWSGLLDATRFGPVCPQTAHYTQTQIDKQSEDCLTLNIYSPVIQADRGETTRLYPVMVYIHGGSYEDGAGNRYDGFCLATHGVVVITINYRLGALGYLSTGDDILPGNYGLRDQIEALIWIRKHVRHFRGNPDRVTIFGNSAGASSAGLLLLIPRTEGLIHAAILQSGPPLSFWAVHNATVDHAAFTQQVALRLGCPVDTLAVAVDCLRRVPYSTFSENSSKFPRISPSGLNFKPRVDGHVLPAFPQVALESGAISRVPVMIGVVREEWARSMGYFYWELTDIDKEYSNGLERESFERGIDHVITKRFWWPSYVAHVIKHAYTDWKNVTHPIQNRANYIHFMTDLTMVAPSVKTATLLARHQVPVYLYRFYHRSVHTRYPWWGSYHSLELDYVFGSPFTGYDIAVDRWVNHTAADRRISRRLMKLWTNFAKNRSPTRGPHSNAPTWQLFEPERLNYYYITAKMASNMEQLRPDKMALWNDLIPKLLSSNSSYPDEGWVSGSRGVTLGMLPRPSYKLLFWVFMGSSLVFFFSFLLVVWKLFSLRRQQQANEVAGERGLWHGETPEMV